MLESTAASFPCHQPSSCRRPPYSSMAPNNIFAGVTRLCPVHQLLLTLVLFLLLRHGNSCLNSTSERPSKCYSVHYDEVSFQVAHRICKSENGRLATASEDGDVIKLLSEQTAASNSSIFWVGFVQDGSPEDKDGQSACFIFNGTHFLEHSCSEEESFICEYSKASPKASSNCPQNSVRTVRSEACIWRTTEAVSMNGRWNEAHAQDICARNGGVLLAFDYIEEEGLEGLRSLLKGQDAYYWIDLSWDGEEILKPSGESLRDSSLISWNPGNGSCIAMNLDMNNASVLKLYQAECTSLKNAICLGHYVESSVPERFEKQEYGAKKRHRRSYDVDMLQCPHGYNWKEDSRTGYCYWETSYETNRLSWKDARKYCQSYGGDLASFHSKQEEMIGLSFQYGSLSHPYWIGLRYNVENDTYEWVDGTPLDYTNWASGQPDHRNNRMRCVQMHAAEKVWMVSYCGVLSWFVCKAPKQFLPPVPVLPTAEPLQSCTSNSSSYFFEGYCYEVIAMQFSWHRSQSYCRNKGANLVSIHSEKEVDFLIYLLYSARSVNANRVWIGLNSISLDGEFRWSDESEVDFVNWNYDEPNNVQNQEKCCNMYVGNGLWNDENCNNIMPFICKRRNGTSAEPLPEPTVAPAIGNCKPGWYSFGRSCYLPVGAKRSDWANWTEAASRCQQHGGYLASVHSEKQQSFLSFILQNIKADSWIGLHDSIHSGVYYWFDNTPVDYTNWAPGEPSFLGVKEDCVLLVYNNPHSGVWKDETCDTELPYICESMRDPKITEPPKIEKNECLHPRGWLKMDTSCFKYFNTTMNFADAKRECEKHHADLVSVSDFTIQAVVKYMSLPINQSFWIGLTVNDEYSFTWANQWPVTLSQWDNNQPDLRENPKPCFVSSPEGYWKAVGCAEKRPFICQITGDTPPIIDYAGGTCKEDYINIVGESCVKFQTDAITEWHAANFACFSEGGNLASIHSLQQVEEMKQLQMNKSFFIGLTRNKKGGFSWSDGSPLDFVYWDQGEPESETDRCVAMLPHSLKWHVAPCHSRKHSVCSVRKVREEKEAISSKDTDESTGENGEHPHPGLSRGALVAVIVCALIVLAAVVLTAVYFRQVKDFFNARVFSQQQRVTSFENALFDPDAGIEMYNNKTEIESSE